MLTKEISRNTITLKVFEWLQICHPKRIVYRMQQNNILSSSINYILVWFTIQQKCMYKFTFSNRKLLF